MSALSQKHRVAVNAALATIHASGGDANAVTRAARTYMASGLDPRKAYEQALNGFAATSPQLAPVLQRVTQLVQASDTATLAKYDTALNHYISTLDDSPLNELQPMIEADFDALDARDDAAEAAGEAPPVTPETPAQPVQQTFRPSAPQQVRAPASSRGGTNTAQTGSPRGYSAPKTGEALARQTGVPMGYTGPAIDLPPSSY